MRKKIFIIDDSALMRRILSDIIDADERFTTVATVANGREALEYLDKDSDIQAILLDLNMPVLDGVGFMKEYNARGYRIPVFIVSAIASQSGKETIEALELGAVDFITKPRSLADVRSGPFAQKLLTVLDLISQCSLNGGPAGPVVPIPERKTVKPVDTYVPRRKVSGGSCKKLVAIACSTGGPKALKDVIPFLPKDLDAPVLIVQHMPKGFTLSLANRLNELSDITVKEAADGDKLCKGVVYIAKGGSQMRLVPQPDGIGIRITKEPPRGGLRPCADIMYESLDECNVQEYTCVVLTGMGSDGAQGIKQLKQTKTVYTIAQNEPTCTVYGMPKAIADQGRADEILPLGNVAEAIVKKVGVH